jgi:hypothetical protein
MTAPEQRQTLLPLIDEACRQIGLSACTVQRWPRQQAQ